MGNFTILDEFWCISGLVVDGSVSFPFNDGTEAILETHPEDALMTVQMDDRLPYWWHSWAESGNSVQEHR
jgi:hypothetical protein